MCSKMRFNQCICYGHALSICWMHWLHRIHQPDPLQPEKLTAEATLPIHLGWLSGIMSSPKHKESSVPVAGPWSFGPTYGRFLDRCLVIWHFHPQDLDLSKSHSTVWTQPLRLLQHSVLQAFWNPRLRSSIHQNHQSPIHSLNLQKTVDWTYAKTTDHANKMLHERTFHHCFGQRSSASSKRLLAAISLVSGCPHEIIEAQWQLTWTLPTGLHGMWFNLWHFDCN